MMTFTCKYICEYPFLDYFTMQFSDHNYLFFTLNLKVYYCEKFAKSIAAGDLNCASKYNILDRNLITSRGYIIFNFSDIL